ncbi:MAG: EamA family transporter [Oligoflexia bacterium]|nr:EamA family transporter [Oligoflexia bacterium]
MPNAQNNLKNQLIGLLMVIISAISFATLGVFANKMFSLGLSANSILAWRFVGAGFILWSLLVIKKDVSLGAKESMIAFLLGLIGYAVASFCFMFAILNIGMAGATVLLYTYTTFSCLLRWFLFKRLPGPKDIIIALISFAGCVLVCGSTSFISSVGKINIGMLAGIISGLVYSLYLILNEKYLCNVSTVKSSAWITVGTGVAFTILSAIKHENIIPLNFADAILPLLGIILVSTILPIVTLLQGIKLIGPVKAAVISTIEPCAAAIFGLILFNQTLSPFQIIGICLVVFSVIGTQNLPFLGKLFS